MPDQLKLKKPPVFDRQKSRKQPITKTVTIYTDDDAVEGLREAEKAVGAAETRRDAFQATLDRTEASGANEEGLLAVRTRFQLAQDELDQATAALQAVLDDLMDHHAASFTVRSRGRKVYELLLLEHPPTEEQNAEHQVEFGANASYNSDTFPAALLHAVCVEPQLELWEWKAFFDWDTLTDEELLEALRAASVGWEGDRKASIAALRRGQPEWNTSELVELTQAAIEVCTHRRVVNLGKAYG